MFSDATVAHPSLAKDNIVDVLRLMRTLNVGPVTFFNLIRRFGTAAEALAALPDLSLRGGRKNPLTACPRKIVLKEIESVQKFGAQFIMYGSPQYPALLHAISDPPPVITIVGHAQLWQNKGTVAMVGSRNASASGCQFAQKIAKELGENNLIVASGLARGIDTYVHKGSLASGTVAVIAGGIDNIYPPENAALYAQIRESGAIISEQAFGSLPYSGAFPGRNRIIAGMSLGTVVVEASPKSGSLITARFAMENNREVFAVPGSPLDPRSKGCNQLIRQGATMVESVGDILSSLTSLRHKTLGENPVKPYAPESMPARIDENELAEMRRVIIGKLGTTAVSVDELIEQCHTTPNIALTILLELELAGRLKRSSGNKVHLTQVIEEDVA
jgi:DNA processing protein